MIELCFCVSHSNDAFDLKRDFPQKKKSKNETSDFELTWLSVYCDCDAFVCGKRGGGKQFWNRLHDYNGTDYKIKMLSVIVAFIFLA